MDNILNEIAEKIKEIPDYKEYKHDDAWFRAGLVECMERAVAIIMEYVSD